MSLVNPIQWYLTFEAFDTNKKYMVDLRVTSSTIIVAIVTWPYVEVFYDP